MAAALSSPGMGHTAGPKATGKMTQTGRAVVALPGMLPPRSRARARPPQQETGKRPSARGHTGLALRWTEASVSALS